MFNHKLVASLQTEIKNAPDLFLPIKDDEIILKTLRHDILRAKDGVMTHICLPTVKQVPAHALYGNKGIVEFKALKAEKLDHNAIYKAFDLERIEMPK